MRALRPTALAVVMLLVAGACTGDAGPASVRPSVAPADATQPGATPAGMTPGTAVPSPAPGSLPEASGQAGLDWTGIAPREWADFEPAHVAAGPAGILVTGVVLGTEPTAPQAWRPAGGGWQNASPPGTSPVAGDAWVAFDLPIVHADSFAILGRLGQADAPDHTVAWRTTNPEASTWERADAVDGWGPRAAAPLGTEWIVLANTMTGLGGPPEATWATTDFVTWREIPLEATGFPYADILRVLPDGSLLVVGRLSTEAVDVVPRPVGELSVWRTADGERWTRTPAGPTFGDASIDDVAVRSDRLVAFGRRWPADMNLDAPAPSAFWWSDDGTTWAAAAGPDDIGWLDGSFLLALDDRFVLLGTIDGLTQVLAISEDGTSWQRPADQITLGGRVRSIVPFDGLLLAVGSTSEAGGAGGAVWVTPLADR
jgi:hypothetical protein